VTEVAMSSSASKRERPMAWTRSSCSTLQNNCVEVWFCPRVVWVRDSKQAPGPVLSFCGTTWWSFLVHLAMDASPYQQVDQHVRGTRLTLLGEGRRRNR
jgi:uncharacterized protein DUF397